ncbi:Wzz/FepE/Etk N-terminal domain-containing protein [Candidatus Omnitrophota bacterium]
MTPHQPYEDEIDLVDYIKVVYKRRIMIITVIIISVLSAGLLSFFKPEMYEASATFFPMNVQERYGAATETLAMKRQLDIEDLIISILESRKMADRIIEQLNLKKLWGKNLMVSTRNALKGATQIKLEINGVIKLSAMTGSPELSAKIANAYVDNLDYFNRQLDIGAQRQIVQVIDRAAVPERRMGRGVKKNSMIAGAISFLLTVFLSFLLEFIQRSGFIKRLKEK